MIAAAAGAAGDGTANGLAKAPLYIFLPHNSNGPISGMCFLYL